MIFHFVAPNQCDGCNRHLPINENGIHYDPQKKGYNRLYMVCCKKDYQPPKELSAATTEK